MSNPKKVISIRSKDNTHNVGSVATGGKEGPKPKQSLPASNLELQNILFKSGAEYRLATQEFYAKYEMELDKAKKRVFAESLSPEAKIAYFKYDGWNGFNLDELIEEKDLETYQAAKIVLKEKLNAASKELSLALQPFLEKREAEFAEAKKAHPKKWWQSNSSYLRDICNNCGNKVIDYCSKCYPNS